jgi:hypothetical protein
VQRTLSFAERKRLKACWRCGGGTSTTAVEYESSGGNFEATVDAMCGRKGDFFTFRLWIALVNGLKAFIGDNGMRYHVPQSCTGQHRLVGRYRTGATDGAKRMRMRNSLTRECHAMALVAVYGGSFQPLSESDRSGRRWEGRAHWGKQCGVARALLQSSSNASVCTPATKGTYSFHVKPQHTLQLSREKALVPHLFRPTAAGGTRSRTPGRRRSSGTRRASRSSATWPCRTRRRCGA